ncbi:MAG: Dihydrodipicolinate synthase, DapA [Candidatus Methanohalarchaeum thermophilum]|uniref:4-hydroxy-tetrahydrodipicolinate synthase n=1 Tax=Methanohalarchaeum thermophilum TaxID=1903181 RepID=A0A1Q6DTC5_METT1|nr:MAG: Dihydrodipicolinate synthase, DapA [Candidatus Methanohalarchaeum thermophilum]
MELKGVFPAIITPFTEDNEIDEEGLRRNIRYLLDNGVTGVVPCGTTGESATLSYEEHDKVIDIAIDTTKKDEPVIAGTGSNSTRETIDLTGYAEDVGADVAMIITPYYNKPNDEGLIDHYKTVAATTELPILVYNVPSRTGTNLKPEVIAELSKIENIIGVKEASGDVSQVSDIIAKTPDDFNILSGNDGQTLPIMSLGGRGTVSVAANIAPSLVSKMVQKMQDNKLREARDLHYKLSPLFHAIFLETNPIPVKTALNMMDRPSGPLRSPLGSLSEENRNKLKKVLIELELI